MPHVDAMLETQRQWNANTSPEGVAAYLPSRPRSTRTLRRLMEKVAGRRGSFLTLTARK